MSLRASGLALVCVLLVSGCGSMSRAEYVGEVERACASAEQRQEKILQQQRDEDLPLAEVASDISDSGRRFVETLKGLDPPDSLRAEHEALLDRLRSLVSPSASRQELDAKVGRVARAYTSVGATRCAERVRSPAGTGGG